MLACSAFWYSTPGACVTPPVALAPMGVATGVLQTKWVVSIWTLSLHLAFISSRASFAFSTINGSVTVPKQTHMPDVSLIVCVLILTTFEGNVPAVVRKMSWKV